MEYKMLSMHARMPSLAHLLMPGDRCQAVPERGNGCPCLVSECQAHNERRATRYLACIHEVFPIFPVRLATRAVPACAMPGTCARARHAKRENAGAALRSPGVLYTCYLTHCAPFVHGGARSTHGDAVITQSRVPARSLVACMNAWRAASTFDARMVA